jgi:hypothetical protein
VSLGRASKERRRSAKTAVDVTDEPSGMRRGSLLTCSPGAPPRHVTQVVYANAHLTIFRLVVDASPSSLRQSKRAVVGINTQVLNIIFQRLEADLKRLSGPCIIPLRALHR